MATNRVFASNVQLTVTASECAGPNDPVESGDPVLFGGANVPGVALGDEDATADEVVVQFGGVYELPVSTADTVAAGDVINADGSGDLTDGSGTAFGVALDAIGSATTATIRVAVNL